MGDGRVEIGAAESSDRGVHWLVLALVARVIQYTRDQPRPAPACLPLPLDGWTALAHDVPHENI